MSETRLAMPCPSPSRRQPSGHRRASLAIVAALAALAPGCSKFQKAPPIELKTESVGRTNLVQSVNANGQLTPIRLIQVGSQVSGTITEIFADFNTRVKSGDVLAKIDPASFERALARAEADLASTKAQEALAVFNLKRARELFQAKLISETEFTQNDVQVQQAAANVKMREAAVESARVDLQRTTIYAPIDGLVIVRNVDAGQTVAASFNTPTLFTIANDLAKMQIELAVSEADIGSVDVAQRVDFGVDAFQNRRFNGKVRQVRYAATTNQNVITYTTVVEVNNPDLKLRPGMTANANIITSEKTNVLRIPASSLRFSPVTLGLTTLPATNQVSTNDVSRRPRPAGMDDLPTPPWMANGQFRRPTDEERDKWLASLTPEQKEKYEKFMAEMRRRRSEGGGGMGGGPGGPGGGGPGAMGGTGGANGPGGGSPRPTYEGPTVRTLYLATGTTDPDGKPIVQAVTVKIGINDGASYEVLEGLKEGDPLVVGSKGGPTPTTASAPASPFGSPFGGGPRR